MSRGNPSARTPWRSHGTLPIDQRPPGAPGANRRIAWCSQDANGKVTERIVKSSTATGQVISTDRVMIEESKLPGGSSTVRETTYRNDLNGNFREAERKTIETRVSGSTTTASTVIDRPTLNGSLETVEKRSAVTEGPADNQHTTESVYRRDGSRAASRKRVRYGEKRFQSRTTPRKKRRRPTSRA